MKQSQGRSRFRGKLTGRQIAVYSGLVAAMLAILLLVPALFPSRQPKPETQPGPAPAAEATQTPVQEAQALLASGDTTAALTLLRARLKANPGDQESKQLLESLSKPAVDAAAEDPTATQQKKPSDSRYTKAPKDMAALLPAAVAGYSPGTATKGDADAAVPFDPQSDDAVQSVRRVLFQAHYRVSSSAARRFVTDVTKRAFPQDGQSVRVGVADGYFGTNGVDTVAVAFSRGKYSFEVIVRGAGTDPVALRQTAIDLATAFPSAR